MTKRSLGAGLMLAAAIAVSPQAGLAQQPTQLPADNTPYGTTSAEFLLFPASARGAALGNAFSALVTDASAVHFNPAGLALMERAGAQASSMSYVADTRYSWLAVGLPMRGGASAVGVSIANFGYSDQPVYTNEDPENASGESYSVSQTALGLTYAQRFSDRFSAGLTAKFINDQLGSTAGRAFAIDFGTMFTANVSGRAIRAGFTVQNLGTTVTHRGKALDVVVNRDPVDGEGAPQEPVASELKSKGWSLPVTFRVSLAYDAFSTARSRLSVLGEFNQPNNSYPGFNFAGEYSMTLGSSLSAAGRIGYTYASDNNLSPVGSTDPGYAGFESGASGESMDGFSAGGGIRWAGRTGFGIGFDYAYRHMGLLGGVNMVSIGLTW